TQLLTEPAPADLVEEAAAAVAAAATKMSRALPEGDLRDLLAGSHDAARWDDVAARCLSCGNCTMVCPTCFCTTVEDVTDVAGEMEATYELLSSQPFLAGLTPAQLDKLSYWTRKSTFHAGTRLFEEGQRADRFWLLREGHVTLDTQVPGQGTQIVETLGPHAV